MYLIYQPSIEIALNRKWLGALSCFKLGVDAINGFRMTKTATIGILSE